MNDTKNINDVDSGSCSCKSVKVTEGEYTIEVCQKGNEEKNRNNKSHK